MLFRSASALSARDEQELCDFSLVECHRGSCKDESPIERTGRDVVSSRLGGIEFDRSASSAGDEHCDFSSVSLQFSSVHPRNIDGALITPNGHNGGASSSCRVEAGEFDFTLK